MASAPLISVIIPLHQGEAYIEEALTSLHMQTLADLEVIVVDDGSSDQGALIAEAHPVGARVVRQRQAGVAAARNRGSLHATGQWLAFLDQDDLWHSTRAERMAPVLRESRHGFVLTSLRSFASRSERELLRASGTHVEQMVDNWVDDDDGAVALCLDEGPQSTTSPTVQRYFDVRDVMAGTLSPTTSFFVRADHLRLIGGWSMHARSIDDWWLMTQAAYLEDIAFVDEPSHLYRLHPGATSRSTKFWYAYTSSLLAMRLGGNFVPRESALKTDAENDVASHLYLEMLRGGEAADADDGASHYTRHMASLLWPSRQVRLDASRAKLRRHLPWLSRIRPWVDRTLSTKHDPEPRELT